jgi:anti-anti-sigma factor
MLVISRKDVGDTTILDLKGNMARTELIEGRQPRFREVVEDLLRAGRIKIIVVYADVEYQDSTGNGDIVSAYTKTRNAGGELVLAGLRGKVEDLFSITRLKTIFRVFSEVSDALAYFGCREDTADGVRQA